MNSVLSDLTGAPAPAAPAPAAPGIPALADAGGAPNVPPQALLVMRGIASGQIPGATMPKDAEPIEADLAPGDLINMGIGIYRPKDASIVAVAYNPKSVSEKMLQGMDKAGTLADNFPSLPDLLAGPAGAADKAAKVPSDGQQPASVQILPKPASNSVQAQAATARINSLSPEPSKRQVPGGGAVLNGLISRAV